MPAVSPLRALPAGDSRIHWGLIRPYHDQVEFGEHRSRPLDQSVHPNSVANSVWQWAKARNRSRAREPDELSRSYPHHHVDTSDRSQSWALQPRDFAARPSPTDPYHRTPQPPGHTEPRYHSATRYDLDQPARDRNHDAQRPQVSAAVPPGGHNFALKSRSVYQKRATSPPA